MLSHKDIEMIVEAARKYLDGDSPTFKFISRQQENFFKRRSGEMANTEDLKSSEVKPHESSSLSSGKPFELEFLDFLKANSINIRIIHDMNRPGWEGHPIAIFAFFKFLKEKYKCK